MMMLQNFECIKPLLSQCSDWDEASCKRLTAVPDCLSCVDELLSWLRVCRFCLIPISDMELGVSRTLIIT